MSTQTVDVKELYEASETVTFSRGNITLSHESYLERISKFNSTYMELANERVELTNRIQSARAKEAFLSADPWVKEEIEKMVAFPATSEENYRFPTLAEIDQRQRELSENIINFRREGDEAEIALNLNGAKTLVYLTAEWSLSEDGQPIECSVENVLKYYSPPLIQQAMNTIEEKVFGFLVIAPDSLN